MIITLTDHMPLGGKPRIAINTDVDCISFNIIQELRVVDMELKGAHYHSIVPFEHIRFMEGHGFDKFTKPSKKEKK